MLTNYIPKRYANALLKHVVAVALFIPYFYSYSNVFAYPSYILANFFAILAMAAILTSWQLDLRRNGILLAGIGILTVAYVIGFLYMYVVHNRWCGEQINTTISFLFFMVLLIVKDSHALFDSTMIRGIIHMIVLSNVCAIGFKLFTEYNGVVFMNKGPQFFSYTGGIEKHFTWLYTHKCQYGFLLVLCVAFCVVYRKQFRNLLTYTLSQGILLLALYLSDSYTSLAAAALIFVGQFLDYLLKAKWWKKLIGAVVLGVPGCYALNYLVQEINTQRDILTLGYRTYIWKGFIKHIQNNPNGSNEFYGVMFPVEMSTPDQIFNTNNCHNVFLNHMFRFSIPVGGIFIAIILLLFCIALKRNFSFQTIFTLLALLLPLNMDHSLTSIELSFFLFLFFLLYFRAEPKKSVPKPS